MRWGPRPRAAIVYVLNFTLDDAIHLYINILRFLKFSRIHLSLHYIQRNKVKQMKLSIIARWSSLFLYSNILVIVFWYLESVYQTDSEYLQATLLLVVFLFFWFLSCSICCCSGRWIVTILLVILCSWMIPDLSCFSVTFIVKSLLLELGYLHWICFISVLSSPVTSVADLFFRSSFTCPWRVVFCST